MREYSHDIFQTGIKYAFVMSWQYVPWKNSQDDDSDDDNESSVNNTSDDHNTNELHRLVSNQLKQIKSKKYSTSFITRYACDQCDRSFKRSNYLKNHKEIVHQGNRAHACDQCGKRLMTAASLRYHIRTHKGLFIFVLLNFWTHKHLK